MVKTKGKRMNITEKHCWYKQYIHICPLCGKEYCYKDEQYSPEPSNANEKVVVVSSVETYDGCMGL